MRRNRFLDWLDRRQQSSGPAPWHFETAGPDRSLYSAILVALVGWALLIFVMLWLIGEI